MWLYKYKNQTLSTKILFQNIAKNKILLSFAILSSKIISIDIIQFYDNFTRTLSGFYKSMCSSHFFKRKDFAKTLFFGNLVLEVSHVMSHLCKNGALKLWIVMQSYFSLAAPLAEGNCLNEEGRSFSPMWPWTEMKIRATEKLRKGGFIKSFCAFHIV